MAGDDQARLAVMGDQALWLRELETYLTFPLMQGHSSYNLENVIKQVKNMHTASHAGEQSGRESTSQVLGI